MTVKYSARSHVGRVRGNNEDNLYVDGVMMAEEVREFPFTIDGLTRPPSVFAVCDGIGGEEDGEMASLLAIQTLLHSDALVKASSLDVLHDSIQAYVNEAHEVIRSATNNPKMRAGTTLALAMAADNGVYCFNVGDSRIYVSQKSGFRQITNDHTVVGEYKRKAGLAVNQPVDLENGNKLTRCLGIGDSFTVEGYPPITGDCRLLICSDGLTDLVSAGEIETTLRTAEATANAADYLLETALKNGGKDNITIIIIEIKIAKFAFFQAIVKKLKGLKGYEADAPF